MTPSLTGKSVIDPTISRFGPYMNKILGISNGNYRDTLLSKKTFSFKINKLSTTDNILKELRIMRYLITRGLCMPRTSFSLVVDTK